MRTRKCNITSIFQLLLSINILFFLGSLTAQAQDDFTWNEWSHNGSTMYLEWKGRTRNMYYLKPRGGLIPRGVREGTLLFTVTRNEFTYSGTAYVFSSCGPKPYQVEGTLSSDLQHIQLRGKAPIVDRNCAISSYRDDVLDFNIVDDGSACGCQCPGELPIADFDEYAKGGAGTSCPYLYAWSEQERKWREYGKVIHVAQGPDRETTERITLKEFATRFRLTEEEPENSYIDKVELRVETKDGAIYLLKPNLGQLHARDGRYAFIPAYRKIDFRFSLPVEIHPWNIRTSSLFITGYYHPLGSARPTQCYRRLPQARLE